LVRWYLLPPDTKIADVELVPAPHDTSRAPTASRSRKLPAVRVADGYLRGWHLARIVAPASAAQRGIQLRLVLRDLPPEETWRPLRPADPHAPEIRWILRHVENPEDLHVPIAKSRQSEPYGGFHPTRWPSLEGPEVEEVVITSPQTLSGVPLPGMVEVWEEFAAWKTARGVPTVVVTVPEIASRYEGFDLPDKIRRFVRDAVLLWGTRWVLLAGEYDVVPTRRLDGEDSADHLRPDPPADLYYVRFQEDWNLDDDAFLWDGDEDVALGPLGLDQAWVGRLPCRDALEARVMVEKIRTYLETPPDDRDYYRSFMAVTGPVNSMHPTSSDCGYGNAEEVLEVFRWAGWPDTLRLYAMVDELWEPCDGEPKLCYEELRSYLQGLDVTPWEGTALRERLSQGFHIAYYLEHSMRDFLGNPTVAGFPMAPEGCATFPSWQKRCFRALSEEWAKVKDFSRDEAYALENAPRYTILFSAGSFTGEHDLESIGEALVRAPSGGCVAFVGKMQSRGGYGAKEARAFFSNLLLEEPRNVGAALSLGIAEVFSDSLEGTRKALTFPLLGDPEMPVWRTAPESLVVSWEPDTLPGLGESPLRIVVRWAAGGQPVDGARVCLQQGDRTYARAWTDTQGEVFLPGLPVRSTEALRVQVTAPDALPFRGEIPVAMGSASLVYAAHEVDDSAPDGDGDGIAEAGETIRLRTWLRGQGEIPQQVSVNLWASPSVRFHISEPGPASILVGASGAHPPAGEFALPPAGLGFRPEGEPPEGSPLVPRLRIWRDPDDGSYWLEATALFPGTSFVGELSCSAGLEPLGTEVEAGVDTVSWGEKTLRFHLLSDDTPDVIRFRADAGAWVHMERGQGLAGGKLAGPGVGDSLAVEWSLVLAPEIPDAQVLPFTLRARPQGGEPTFSDFALSLAAPDVELLWVEEAWDPESQQLSLWPVLRNSGTGDAESVAVRLVVTQGPGDVLEAETGLDPLEPGDVGRPKTPLVLVGPSQETLWETVYRLELEVATGAGVVRDTVEGLGGTEPPEAPEDPVAEASGEGIVLRWDPAPGASRYVVELLSEDAEPVLAAVVDSVTRAEILEVQGRPLEAVDAAGILQTYRLGVRACAAGRCGSAAVAAPQRPWLPMSPGWPRKVPDGIRTAPTVVPPGMLGPQGVVFVAGRRIYAWYADGTPLVAEGDGLLYDPELPQGGGRGFNECLALFPFGYRPEPWNWPQPAWALAATAFGGGLYVLRLVPQGDGIHYETELLWRASDLSTLSAPLVWAFRRMEGWDNPQIFVPGNRDTLYAWLTDGTPALSAYPTGAVAVVPDGAKANYNAMAVAQVGEPDHFLLVQSTRTGHLLAWEIPSDPSSEELARRLWDVHLEVWEREIAAFSLSAPAVGDVDGDGREEVVVTNQTGRSGSYQRPGRIWVVDAGSGEIRAWAESPWWRFRSPSDELPAPRPSLTNLDGRPGAEILVAGRVESPGGAVSEHRLHVFTWRDSELKEWRCRALPPLPSRNSGNIGSATIWREPIPCDVDGDGRLEILGPSGSGALFAWETEGDSCVAVAGWPLLLGDLATTPAVEDLDADGYLELVVASRDGLVQVYELPSEVGVAAPSSWTQQAADMTNTARVKALFGLRPAAPALPGQTALRLVGPNPFTREQTLRLSLPRRMAVSLEVLDVTGRRVRLLHRGPLEAGEQTLSWDARNDAGRRVASGVYFYRLRFPAGVLRARTLLLD
jgi:hypothetical protein